MVVHGLSIHTLKSLNFMYMRLHLDTKLYLPLSAANKVYGNRRTLEDAIKLGKCLYSVSGDNSYPMHDFYIAVLPVRALTQTPSVSTV